MIAWMLGATLALPPELEVADHAMADAVGAHDEAAFRTFLGAHSRFVSPVGIARGPEDVVADWAPLLAEGGPSLAWWPADGGVARSGDLGWTSGPFRYEQADRNGKVAVAEGDYFTVWLREGTAWTVWADVTKVGPPPTGATREELAHQASGAGDLVAEIGTWTHGDAHGTYVRVRNDAVVADIGLHGVAGD